MTNKNDNITSMAKQTNINIRVEMDLKATLEEKARLLNYPSLTTFLLMSAAENNKQYVSHFDQLLGRNRNK